jgi:hypothetical protein
MRAVSPAAAERVATAVAAVKAGSFEGPRRAGRMSDMKRTLFGLTVALFGVFVLNAPAQASTDAICHVNPVTVSVGGKSVTTPAVTYPCP